MLAGARIVLRLKYVVGHGKHPHALDAARHVTTRTCSEWRRRRLVPSIAAWMAGPAIIVVAKDTHTATIRPDDEDVVRAFCGDSSKRARTPAR